MSDQIWWYATRAAGLMTWSTAVASVIVGLILVIPPVKKRVGDWFHDLHRYLGSVSVIFLVAHLGSLYLDSVAGFGIRELLIPGESTWEPSAAAWGVVAAWSLVAVQLTSLVRKHISDFVWRGIHVVAVLTVVAGTYHAWLGGTDVDNPITWSIAGLGSVLVVALIAVRLRRTDEGPVDGEERLSDREALLTEMRERLENLPIPEPPASPQITLEAAPTLPRRSPTTVAASSPLDDAFPPEPGPITADTAFSSDPFAAMPLGADNPELSEWVGRSTSDPFEQPPVDPFRNNAPGPGDNLGLGARPSGDPFSQPRPFTEQTPSNPFTEPTGANPFPEIEARPPFTEPAPANPFTDSPPANPFTDSPPANPFTESASPDSFVEPAVPAQDPWPAPSSDAATLGQLPVSEPAPTHQPPSPYGSEARRVRRRSLRPGHRRRGTDRAGRLPRAAADRAGQQPVRPGGPSHQRDLGAGRAQPTTRPSPAPRERRGSGHRKARRGRVFGLARRVARVRRALRRGDPGGPQPDLTGLAKGQ